MRAENLPKTPHFVKRVVNRSRGDFAQERVDTGNIVLSKDVVRVDGQRSGYPFLSTVRLPNANKSSGAEVGRPRILRMNGEFALCSFDASSRGTLFLPITAN